MKKTILTSLATLGALAAFAAPAQAATAPTTAIRVAYHAHGHGYFFAYADKSNIKAGPRSDALHACSTAACRANVKHYYAGLHHMWRAYNRQVWAASNGLPACGSLADNDCLFSDGTTPFTVLRDNGVSYFVQTSTRP